MSKKNKKVKSITKDARKQAMKLKGMIAKVGDLGVDTFPVLHSDDPALYSTVEVTNHLLEVLMSCVEALEHNYDRIDREVEQKAALGDLTV